MSDTTLHQQRRRDYFAARAPADIPPWFKHEFPAAPTLPHVHELTPKQRKQWEGLGDWLNDADVDADVIAFRQRWQNAFDAIDSHARARISAEFFAWRWHYAEMMVAAANHNRPNDPASNTKNAPMHSIPI